MSTRTNRDSPAASPGSAPKLEVRDLHKTFGDKVVLDGVSFALQPGESLVVVGPSGTGKSVLLKHLIGLLRPDSGNVLVDGQDLWALDAVAQGEVRKKFGMSFQEGALFDSMSVFDNVAFPLRRSGRPPAQVRARVKECLEIVHLPDVTDKRPAELSGGMRRRVGFARAIAHEPQILLFDEPNTGLDPIMTDVIDDSILEMRQRLRATIVTITHHMPSAQKVGDRVALLFGGKILYEASPDEFLRSDDPAVKQFVEGKAEGPLTVDDDGMRRPPSDEGGTRPGPPRASKDRKGNKG
ncbi:MAG TPA: ABC transporter ATP-binding protein [Thermoanaerobaculia bacterium]|nr:ABC transporter ATP-binding protein [Thermoanaerobaculia bacterium]